MRRGGGGGEGGQTIITRSPVKHIVASSSASTVMYFRLMGAITEGKKAQKYKNTITSGLCARLFYPSHCSRYLGYYCLYEVVFLVSCLKVKQGPVWLPRPGIGTILPPNLASRSIFCCFPPCFYFFFLSLYPLFTSISRRVLPLPITFLGCTSISRLRLISKRVKQCASSHHSY